jgi:hypothetical protein
MCNEMLYSTVDMNTQFNALAHLYLEAASTDPQSISKVVASRFDLAV